MEFEFCVLDKRFFQFIGSVRHCRMIPIGKLTPDFLKSSVCKSPCEEDDALSGLHKSFGSFFTSEIDNGDRKIFGDSF